MEFDLRSLLGASSMLSALSAIVMLIMRQSFPASIGGLGYWAGGCLAAVAATALLSVRGLIPNFFGIVLANTMSVAGFMLFYAGLRDFYGLRSQVRPLLALLLLAAALIAWFTYVQVNHNMLSLVVPPMFALLMLASAKTIYQSRQHSAAAYLTMVTLLSTAGVSIARVMTILTDTDAFTHFLEPTLLQKIYLASFSFFTMSLTLGLMLMANERLRTNLEYTAMHDSLTGAYNRGAVLDMLSREMARFHRHGRPLAILMFDLDHFKRINDDYGHLTGDKVIIDFAHRVTHLLRKQDCLGRYGGEEFVALLPETTLDEAGIVATRICTATALSAQPGLPLYTVSIGVATSVVGSTSINDLLTQADRCLYRAKKQGRNCVVLMS